MRSLEFGRPMLRVTNTGISALIDYQGNVVTQGSQFEALALNVTVTPRQGSTPYVRLGDWLAVGLAIVMQLVSWLFGRRVTA